MDTRIAAGYIEALVIDVNHRIDSFVKWFSNDVNFPSEFHDKLHLLPLLLLKVLQ